MAFEWDPLALPGLLAYAGILAIALGVFLTRPDQRRNRRLAALVLMVGTTAFVVRPMRLLLPDPAGSYGLSMTGLALMGFLPLVYVRFLITLRTPLVDPFRRPAGMAALWAYAGACLAAILVAPERVIVAMEPFTHVRAWAFIPGWANVIELATTAFLLFSFAVAVSAARRARTPTSRRETRTFAVAFGVHDGLLASWLLFLAVDGVWNEPITDTTLVGNYLNFLVEPIASLLLAMLLAYGILRHQILGIELTVKRNIARGTVVGAIVLTFLMVSEGIEQFVVGGRAGTIGGLVAAALLALAFRPLERAATQVTDRLMPGVEDTPAYRAERARQIYAAAVESAWLDGRVTKRERALLGTLAAELGVSDADAASIETAASRRLEDAP